MQIGIDATLVRGNRITGIERYVIELITHLAKLNADISFIVFCSKNGIDHFRQLPGHFHLMASPFENRILTEQVWLPYAIRSTKVDLVHLTTLAPSLLINKKSILTVYDAVPWLYPETTTNGMKYYYKPILTSFIKRKNSMILTISNSAANDIINAFSLREERVRKIHIGVSNRFVKSSSQQIGEALDKLNINGKYILAIGTLEPRKNLVNLVKAFTHISKQINANLLIVGRKGWEKELSIPASLEDRIITTGFISDDDMIHILSGAEMLVFPSIYEGFGLPVIEAQRCEVPTIVSNCSSLPEITSQTSMYFDPYDIDDIGSKIVELYSKPELKESLVVQGLLNSKKFQWEETAFNTLELYKEVLTN